MDVRKIVDKVYYKVFDKRNFLFDYIPLKSRGVEVGVWRGKFSKKLLRKTKPSELILIDPWEFQDDYSNRLYGGKVAESQRDMDSIYKNVVNKFKESDEVRIIREKSTLAAKKIPDESVDWVYIDGNHYYEFVKKDLNTYFNKVKVGGMLIGDDYNWGASDSKVKKPVKKAVHDFIRNNCNVQLEKIWNNQYVLKKYS